MFVQENLMAAVSVIPGVWWVGCGSWGGVTEVLSAEGSGNVFLVGAEGEYALVDAGTADGVAAVIGNSEAAGAGPGAIKRVVLTHTHPDHILGAPQLREKTGALVAAGTMAAKTLSLGPEDTRLPYLRLDTAFDTFKVAETLDEDDEVLLGPYPFRVIFTPGHIPDAVTLTGRIEGRTVVFTGDTAIGDQGEAKGVVGWLDGHWQANPKHLLKSIKRIEECNAEVMLPGHGYPIIGREAVRTSLAHCAERLRQLLAIPGLNTMMPLDLEE